MVNLDMPIIRPGDSTSDKTFDEYLAGTEAYRKGFEEDYERRAKRGVETSSRIRRPNKEIDRTGRVREAKFIREAKDLFSLQSEGLKQLDKEEYEKALEEKPIFGKEEEEVVSRSISGDQSEKKKYSTYEDYSQALTDWTQKYGPILGRGEERYQKSIEELEKEKELLEELDKEQYEEAKRERPSYESGNVTPDDNIFGNIEEYSKALGSWSDKYKNIFVREEDRVSDVNQFLGSQQDLIKQLDKEEYEKSQEEKPVYKKGDSVPGDKFFGTISEYSKALNDWIDKNKDVLSRDEDRVEQTNRFLEDQDKMIKTSSTLEVLAPYGVGNTKEDLLQKATAKWVEKEVDDIVPEKRYDLYRSMKSGKYVKVAGDLTESQLRNSQNSGLIDRRTDIKEKVVQVNRGKKTVKEIEGEGDYAIEYRPDGTIAKVTAKPKEYVWDSGFSKKDPQKLMNSYIPYIAEFDEKGNLIKEIKYDIGKTKSEYDKEWGKHYQYSPYQSSIVEYSKEGIPKLFIAKELGKTIAGTTPSMSGELLRADTGYSLYDKEIIDFTKEGDIRTKKEFGIGETSFTAQGPSAGQSQFTSYLDKLYDYEAGELTDYDSPQKFVDLSRYSSSLPKQETIINSGIVEMPVNMKQSSIIKSPKQPIIKNPVINITSQKKTITRQVPIFQTGTLPTNKMPQSSMFNMNIFGITAKPGSSVLGKSSRISEILK